MRTLYFLLLYRPNGSKTWTPYDCTDAKAGNFFTSLRSAMAYARIQSAKGYRVWLVGDKQWATLEFKVASVHLAGPEPDWPPKNYRHPPMRKF